MYEIRFRWWAIWWRNLFASKSQVRLLRDKFFKDLCPVGEDPTRFTVSVPQWAGESSLLFASCSPISPRPPPAHEVEDV